MKRTFTFLMMSLFLCVGMVKADVTDLPQITTDLENPIYYTIYNTRSSQPGGLMYYAGDAVGLKDGCPSFGDKYKFFFTGSHEALYIHNAATANKLASVDSWTAEGTEWAVGVSPKGTGLAIGPKGGLNGNNCINEKNFATNESTSDFTTWSANDDGSVFVMELAEDYVFPMTDLFYVIECPLFEKVQGVKKALYVNAEGNAAWATEDLADLNYYWIPTVKEDGTVALKNLGADKYLSNTAGAMSVDAVYAAINALGANSFNIKFDGNALHANGHGGGNSASGGLTNWGGAAGSASAWQFVQREDPTKLQEAVVTYNLTYGDEVKYTQTVTTLVGEEWPAITVALPYTVSATKPEGVIAAEDLTDGAVTMDISLTIGELPFVAAADVESIDTWYYVKMHSNSPKYIQYLTDQTYLEWVDAEKDETAKDTYAWAFVGNIFDGFKVVNKAAAKAMQSTADGAVVLVDYADASQYVLAATRETSEAAKSGFCLRRPDANKECLNASAGKVAHWWDNDAGSTFMLEVVENVPEVEYADAELINAFMAEVAAIGELPYDLEATWASLPAVLAALEALDPIIEQLGDDKPVVKTEVEAAIATVANAKAVATYYNETYLPTAKAAAELLAALENGSAEHTALSAAIAACDLSVVTTVAEIEAINTALAEAVEANTPEGGLVKTDYTDAIKNADLATGDAWNTEGTKGISGGMVKVASESAFDFSQTITLPAGQYKMTAKAVYRYTGSEAEEFAAIEAGTKTRLVNLYAETATYKYEADVMNRYDGASDTDYAAGNGSVPVNGKFVPNSSSAVQAWFNNGQYVNELVFNVQEEGQIKIGLTRTGSIAGDYTNIGAWTLTRLGDAEADPEVEEPTPDPDPTPDPEETIDMDLTHLVGTSRDAWIGNNGGPVNIDGISLPEKYETTTATLGDVMWQTVTGLENGKYTVELWANARYTPGRGFESAAADGALDFTYLYANNVEISIEVYHNSDLNNGKSYKLEGVEVTDGTLKMGMTKKAAGSNWHTIQIKSLIYHAPANAALDMAKVDLQAALDAANAVEPKKDDFVAAIAAAQGVYDNSKSVEEIEAATATLLEATKLAILGNASPSNPVLTDFVVNGTFDTTTAPWQTTTGAQNQALASNQGGAFSVPFFENWNPSAVTGKIYQVIENVPNGIYDLSICAFVNTFDASAQFVYANADKVALTAGEPTAYTVRTIVENNTIEVGFEQTVAVANWFGIDNISLTYLGEYSNDAEVNMAKANFTAAYDEFNAALAACQAMMLKTNFYEVADAADQLNAQLESTTDIEALNAMVAQLNEATASLNEINAVYAEYDVYVQKFKAAAEWSEPLTTEAAELLEYNMYGGAGMQAMSLDALKQAIEQIKADYVTYAGNAKLYDGNMFDFTYLIQNPNFEANLDGWTGNKANRIGGEGYDGVGGIAEIGEWGATSWDASMSQAITNLPNGKYVVKAAWMAASGIEMTFAANAGETTVTGIGDMGGNIAKDGSVVEMGKGHRGWQYVEVEGLVEDGTLTILVSSSSAAQYQWSNADAFELYYAGVPAPAEPEYLTVVGAKVGDVAIVEGAATVESISSFEITFDRPVVKVEDAEWAQLTDKWGDNPLKAEVLEDNNCVVRFSLQWDVFTEAGTYYLYIPEGVVADAENADIANTAIEAVITIEGGSVEPATPLAVVNVTVGEDVMSDLSAIVAAPETMIKVNFDGKFYFQGEPSIVDAEGEDASSSFEFMNGLDLDGSNSYIFMGKKEGTYTITLAKAQFNELEMMGWKAPAEDIVLKVTISVPDGIQNINVDADAVIYDIHGRRVTEMTKGLYIVNGKKVIVK